MYHVDVWSVGTMHMTHGRWHNMQDYRRIKDQRSKQIQVHCTLYMYSVNVNVVCPDCQAVNVHVHVSNTSVVSLIKFKLVQHVFCGNLGVLRGGALAF